MPQGENNKSVVKRKDYESAAQKNGKNYLLVIGIDAYLHCPTLYNAVKDATDIVEVLKTRFRFDSENITTLYNEKANKRNIYNAFRSFRRKVTSQDNFLVYFSGHGEFDKDFGLGYWIPVNAELGAVDAYIPNSEIRNIFSSIESHHTFLMVDSCFSGALFAKGTGKNISLRKERDPSRWGLTAGRNEIVTDGEPGKNSPFAESILYQLKTATQPIGVAELCDKVLEVVSANANQTPRGEPLKVDGHKGGQFVFHLKMDEVGDWNKALETNSVTAFQSFLTKYRDSKNIAIAEGEIKALQAESLWQKIELAKFDNLEKVKTKLRLVNQFVDKYEDHVHYDEALNIGELLDYKKQFLQAKSSEFALRRFLRKRTPAVAGASAIRKTAQEQVSNWDNVPIEPEEPAKIIPPVKKKAAEKPKIKPVPKPVTPIQQESSFFEKYGKYLLLLLIPILGYVIYQAMDKGGSNITQVNKPTVIDKIPDDTPRISQTQKGYNQLIIEGTNYYNEGNYDSALSRFKTAKGKVSNNADARRGITKCQDKLDEIEKNRRAKLAAEQKNQAHDKAWLNAKNTNTVLSYKAYQKKYKNGKYYSDATNQIKKLRKEAAKNTNSGTFKDSHDGQTYKWVRLKDGKKWMAQNLNRKTANSWCYDDKSSNCTKYGRLYNWQAAKKACPSGWRLPTDDDWWKMASYYGKSYNSRSGQQINKEGDAGQAAYEALMQGGNNGFSALLGGFRGSDGSFNSLGDYGYYWSSSEQSSSNAWRYYFRSYSKDLYRLSGNKSWGFSCRCLQD